MLGISGHEKYGPRWPMEFDVEQPVHLHEGGILIALRSEWCTRRKGIPLVVSGAGFDQLLREMS